MNMFKISNKYIGAMIFVIASFVLYLAIYTQLFSNPTDKQKDKTMKYEIEISEQEWKEKLSPKQYEVLRKAGTERAFTGKYNLHFEKGDYKCAGCGSQLFDSKTKFESHCGWPSFDNADSTKVIKREDKTFGMTRIEVLCRKCGGHLGHLFDDGPTKSGLRYCINSASITFSNDSLGN